MKKIKQKTLLFVDGSNLYAGQYQLFGPHYYLNFKKIIHSLNIKFKIIFDHIYFYASYSPVSKKPTKKEKLFLKNEALFYKNVKSIKNLTFFKGYRSKTSGKEKEVDVKLAVDIVNFTHLNKFDKLFLCSGDADFMHALKIADNKKKKVNILALEDRIPHRFSYLYLVHVICFKSSPSLNINKNKKIIKIVLNQEKYLQKV